MKCSLVGWNGEWFSGGIGRRRVLWWDRSTEKDSLEGQDGEGFSDGIEQGRVLWWDRTVKGSLVG